MFKLDGIDHVALAVRDVRRSAAWYETVLGLERRYQDAWGDLPAVVGVGTTSIALFPVSTPDPMPVPARGVLAMRHLAFRASAAGFAEAQESLRQQGISFAFQDHQIAWSIYFDDPDGHQIEITTYEIG